MTEATSKIRPLFVPWRKIAGLAVLSAPPVLLAYAAGLPLAAAVLGFTTGFLSALVGRLTWALLALAAAVLGYSIMGLLPGEGMFATGLILCAASFSATRLGGGRAMAYGAVGWVFLAFYDFGPAPGIEPIAMFLGAGIWAVPSAHWLGVVGLTAPKPPFAAPDWRTAGVIAAGFLATLALAVTVPVARPYWVPFVFLHIIASSGLGGPKPAIRRLLGAVLGVAVVTVFLPEDTPRVLTLMLAGVSLTIALRLLLAYPILARALTTIGILLVLAPVEQGITDARLVAEVLGVGVLCVTAVLVSILKPAQLD